MTPLGLLEAGEQAVITGTRAFHGTERKEKCLCQAEHMGLRVGTELEVLKNEGHGPILVKVVESRLAIGRGMAMRILVRRAA